MNGGILHFVQNDKGVVVQCFFGLLRRYAPRNDGVEKVRFRGRTTKRDFFLFLFLSVLSGGR